jgi:hypothetical protein
MTQPWYVVQTHDPHAGFLGVSNVTLATQDTVEALKAARAFEGIGNAYYSCITELAPGVLTLVYKAVFMMSVHDGVKTEVWVDPRTRERFESAEEHPEWVPLKLLPPGTPFKTRQSGIRAVKTELPAPRVLSNTSTVVCISLEGGMIIHVDSAVWVRKLQVSG